MEGIADGMAVDDCFYCALLFRGQSSCAQCGNRFRYRAATMRQAESVEASVDNAVAAYLESPERETATALLTLWHELGEEALAFDLPRRVALEQLRAHFEPPASLAREPGESSDS